MKPQNENENKHAHKISKTLNCIFNSKLKKGSIEIKFQIFNCGEQSIIKRDDRTDERIINKSKMNFRNE